MSSLLELNVDYLLLLHGIALVALASWLRTFRLIDLHRQWSLLSTAALVAAAQSWTWIAHVDGGLHLPIVWMSRLFSLAFFVLLFEFARRSQVNAQHRRPLLAVLGAAVLLALVSWSTTHPTLGLIVRVPLYLAVGVWTARMICTEPKSQAAQGWRCGLSPLSLAFVGTAVAQASGSLEPLAASNPGSIGSERVLPVVGSVCCLVFALAALACAIRLVRQRRAQELTEEFQTSQRVRDRTWTAMVLAVLLAGWLCAVWAAHQKERDMEREILALTQTAAAMVDPDICTKLYWDERDLQNPEYKHLKKDLSALAAVNRNIRFAMVMGIRGPNVHFLADSEVPTSPDYSPPGQLYEDAEPAYLSRLAEKRPFVLGPISDHWGTWVSCSVPLADFGPEKGRATFDMDVTAGNWYHELRQARLPVVLITLLISGLLLTFSRAQERIRESLHRLGISEEQTLSLVEGSPECILMMDANDRCVRVNQAGVKKLGRPESEILGRTYADLWPVPAQAMARAAVNRTLKGQSTTFEADYVSPAGDILALRSATNPTRDANGKISGYVCISIDITDRKKAERALVAAKDAAEAATSAKSEFLAVMSHEIRTPLAAVIGMLELLQKPLDVSERGLYTELAHDSAEKLLHILDDVLDSSKIEAGKLSLEQIPFVTQNEFRSVLEGARLRAEAKGLELRWSVAPDVPAVLIGDPTRLRQVLSNLLHNAIKFTERGAVDVEITAEAEPAVAPTSSGEAPIQGTVLSMTVRDTGIGIPSEVKDRLFTRFAQADLSTTRKYGGTGLGLSIVKTLAELMGGTIALESVAGFGSTFTFTARLGVGDHRDFEACQMSAQPMLPQHPAKLHLLYAEDDPPNQVIVEFLVKHMGHTIEFAENGREALERLRSRTFDAVLMDNRMPVMDGFQATRSIRSPTSEVADHDVYIIAITANASNQYRDHCLAAGMNDYLTKPVREAVLHAALTRAISYQKKRGAPLVANTQATPVPAPNAAPIPPANGIVGLSEAELLALVDDANTAPAPEPEPAPVVPPEVSLQMTTLYLRDAPIRLGELRKGVAEKNASEAGRAAHSLKGISRYVAADKLVELGARLETLADHGQFAETLPLIAEAEQEFEMVKTRLERSVHSQLLSRMS